MQKYITIALFCSVFSTAFAQMVIPGYQGKRFSAEINANLLLMSGSPSAEGGGATTFFKNKTDAGIPMRYDLSLNYAVGRQYSLALDYGIGQTGLITIVNSRAITYSDNLDVLSKVNFSHIGFGYNGFGKGSGALAPIGNYISVKALYITATGEPYKIAPSRNSFSGTTIPEPQLITPSIESQYSITRPTAQMLHFQFGVGARRILHKHLFINFSTFGGFSINLKPTRSYSDTYSEAYYEAVGNSALFERMALHYGFHLQLGVGHLIF
jgi:hypothetical protein